MLKRALAFSCQPLRMILCISRNESKLAATGELLRRAGLDPFLCLDPADALRLLAYQPVAVIVIDEELATPDGQAVLKKARSRYPRIPMVYCTEATEPSPDIAALDPDVIVSQADGDQELLRVLYILLRA